MGAPGQAGRARGKSGREDEGGSARSSGRPSRSAGSARRRKTAPGRPVGPPSSDEDSDVDSDGRLGAVDDALAKAGDTDEWEVGASSSGSGGSLPPRGETWTRKPTGPSARERARARMQAKKGSGTTSGFPAASSSGGGGSDDDALLDNMPSASDELDVDDLPEDPFGDEEPVDLRARMGLTDESSEEVASGVLEEDSDAETDEFAAQARRTVEKLSKIPGRKKPGRPPPAPAPSSRRSAREEERDRKRERSERRRAREVPVRGSSSGRSSSERPRLDSKRSKPKKPEKERTGRIPAAPPRSPPGVPAGGPMRVPMPKASPAAMKAARDVIAKFRDACAACAYRKTCVYAPATLVSDRESGRRDDHPHQRFLAKAVRELKRAARDDWQDGLVMMLAGREKDGLLAGCMLAEGLRPSKLRRIVEEAAERYDATIAAGGRVSGAFKRRPDDEHQPLQMAPEALAARMTRYQALRALALQPEEEAIDAVEELARYEADDEGRLASYEAAALLAIFLARAEPTRMWVEACEKRDHGLFRATFAVRDTWSGEDADSDTLSADVLFPYVRGRRRTYLYLRREPSGVSQVASVDKVRIDSLLKRIFRIFDTDEKKTWRVFKEICRHLNVRAGRYSADGVLDGFEALSHEELMLLGLYAPALARAVGAYLELDGYDDIVKFLYKNRGESGRRGGDKVPTHQKVFESREKFDGLRERLSDEVVKDFFKIIFRLNDSYTAAQHTANTYYKLGEVAYLCTVTAGWNSKGLELSLRDSKPLGYIAYGMQPKTDSPEYRYRKLKRARTRSKDKPELQHAIETGMKYLGIVHGFEDHEEFADEMEFRLGRPLPRRSGSYGAESGSGSGSGDPD